MSSLRDIFVVVVVVAAGEQLESLENPDHLKL